MFKTAATKIAHNSTLPALGGNNDLRPLQDLITAEKAVLISLQKLSSDFSKASEALRAWGLGEGDDLGDILSASTTVLTHFSSALSQYAAHGHAIRDQLKAIRTREESLDDLRKRRRATLAKADSAEKKLIKMNPEHKNLAMQTDTLNRLRDEIRTMDSDIMTEEAAIGDFKRSTTRFWMGLKFGGLLECCEKGTIAGEFGKLLIAEIPEEITQPGLPRSMYYGHTKTDALVAEAHRCVSEVTLSTVAAPRRVHQQLPNVPQDFQQGQEYQANYQIQSQGGATWNNDGQSIANYPSDFNPQAGRFPELGDGPSSPTSLHSPYTTLSNQNNIPSYGLPEIQDSRPDRTVDDFGVNNRTPAASDLSVTGGRFATFPINNRDGPSGGYNMRDNPPSLSGRLDDGQTLSMSIAEALSADSPNNNLMNPHNRIASIRLSDPPAPPYEPTPPPLLHSRLPPSDPGSLQVNQGHSHEGSSASGLHQRQESQGSADGSDALLAYMTTPSEGNQTPSHSEHFDEEEIGRHVRFGQVSDVDNEIERRHVQPNVQAGPSQPQVTPDSETEANNKPPSDQNSTKSETSGIIHPSIRRIPPPSLNPEEDERALNAAAAREVTREMDALHFSPPAPLDRTPGQPIESTPDHGRSNYNDYNQHNQPNASPLAHPSAPFTQRSVSPHPYAELNSNSYNNSPTYNAGQSYQASSTYSHSQNGSPAQNYAQSFQSPSSYGPSQASITPPEVHLTPTNPLPPRFQALAQSPNLTSPDVAKNPLPPRFQAALANPPPHDGQPTPIGPLPPRFQNSLGQSSPGTSDQDRFMPVSNTSTPYRTPQEYPRNLGAPPFNKSSTSLNSPAGTPGGRTISVAAFRRPPPHKGSGDGIGLPGPGLKKRLPSSPYPTRGGTDMTRDVTSQPGGEIDEEFDYIGAYVNAESEAPNQSRGPDGGAKPGGYAEGRFATDLESNLR